MYYIENLSPSVIQEQLQISPPTYNRYIQLIQTLDFSISTDFLEKELTLMYQLETDPKVKLKILDSMQKIWAIKSKVPQEDDETETLDLNALRGNPTDAATPT